MPVELPVVAKGTERQSQATHGHWKILQVALKFASTALSTMWWWVNTERINKS